MKISKETRRNEDAFVDAISLIIKRNKRNFSTF